MVRLLEGTTNGSESNFFCPSVFCHWANLGLHFDLQSAFNTCLSHLIKCASSSDADADADADANVDAELRFPTSIQLLIDGTVPAGSGLSSSAAITTASVLAVLYMHQSPKKQHVISKSLVASLAIAAEKACGISVGGMDQTASVFGQPAKLLHMYVDRHT
jgi:galactokinase